MNNRRLQIVLYWSILVLSVILFGFCLFGLFHSIILYTNGNNENYISAISAWSVGIFAALIQFFIIVTTASKSTKKIIKFTNTQIKEMRDFLNKYSFFRVAVANVNIINGLNHLYNNANQTVIFIRNPAYLMHNYIMDVCNHIIANPLYMSEIFSPETLNDYLSGNPNAQPGCIASINSFTIHSFHDLCGRIDSFLSNYYNGLFNRCLADSFLHSLIDEFINSLYAYVLFERDETIRMTGGIEELDHKYVLQYIEEEFASR